MPAGKRLVITNVTGEVDSAVPGGNVLLLTVIDGGGAGLATIPMIYSGQRNNKNSFAFNQQALLFYNAGEIPYAQFEAFGPPALSFGTFTLRGYLLDCTAAPCAAIAP